MISSTSCHLCFLKHLYLPKEPHYLLHLINLVSICHPEYCVSFCCPYIGGSLLGNVLLLVSGFHMLHFLILEVGYFFTSNVQSQPCVSNTYSTKFDLILPTAVVGTFPFYDAWFIVVQLCHSLCYTKFLFHLMVKQQYFRGHPCCLVCFFISFKSYVCRTLHRVICYSWLWNFAGISYI